MSGITRASCNSIMRQTEVHFMNNIVYIVGAIVIVLVILSVLGLR